MLTGSADLESLAARAPTMDSLDTEPLRLDGVEVLQALFEQPYAARQTHLPAGLHPTIPPMLVILAWKVAKSEWGPFTVAQARVSCRSGVRPRGFVVGCLTDNDEAAAGLRARFGLPAQTARLRLDRHYDGVNLTLTAGGRTALELTALDPDPLGPGDVQFTVTTTLAHTPRGLRLVQVEPEYELQRVERVRPQIHQFDAEAWGAPGLLPAYPVAATISVGAITIPKLRFVSQPDALAFVGTERI
jgi:hypothetical protein